tara:strand:+ start:137 stop:634 length:498 start_codon:yes stop_codon:yes gene_type:complete
MLVNCKSCHKKFVIPNAAITESGRLLQCGSCGTKWTQFPVKEIIKQEVEKTASVKIISIPKEKKKTVKRNKRKINLYTQEYLQNKHGLKIQDSTNNSKNSKAKKEGFGFYGYLTVTIVLFVTIFGILNISKDFLIINYPTSEPHIINLYEIIEIIKVLVFELINN